MRSEKEVTEKLHQVNKIRHVVEKDVIHDLFRRGQLSGAQQALAWILEEGMEPVRAILIDEELDLLPNHLR